MPNKKAQVKINLISSKNECTTGNIRHHSQSQETKGINLKIKPKKLTK